MSLEETRKDLRSQTKVVCVVAPAGCGKTFEACKYALEVAESLATGEQVLFLAHTNAAVQEFRIRTRKLAPRVDASTIDAFCLELLLPYAARLGLPTPLQHRLGREEGCVPFEDLARFVGELLKRSPSIANLYAGRYPVIILDEHQDASEHQHGAIQLIGCARRVRLRIFGDPMQAIFEDDERARVSWNAVESCAEIRAELDFPQRWKDVLELGNWILELRKRLKSGQGIPPLHQGLPITFHPIDIEDPGFKPTIDRQVVSLLHKLLNSLSGSTAVLGWLKNHVYKLQVASNGRLILNEGAEFDDAYAAVERLQKAIGKPMPLAKSVVKVLAGDKCGFTSIRMERISNALGRDRITDPRSVELKALIDQLRPIYDTPDLATACKVIREISRTPPAWLAIRTPECFSILGRVRPNPGDDPKELLRQLIIQHKLLARRRTQIASTIHKSKGLEFDHVVLTNFGAKHFCGSEQSRRLAYVALSRARRSIHIVIPTRTPSPLLSG